MAQLNEHILCFANQSAFPREMDLFGINAAFRIRHVGSAALRYNMAAH